MKKLLLLAVLVFVFNHSSFSKQWLIFHAENAGPNSTAGHVFISFFKENKDIRQTVHEYSWGFYPERKELKILWGEIVPGEVKDDYDTQKDQGLLVEVNDAEYKLCLAAINLWNNQRYQLFEHNCIDFVRDIASIIPRIHQPHGAFFSPKIFIDEFKRLNRDLELQSERNFKTNQISYGKIKSQELFTNETNTTKQENSELAFLKNFAGKYPFDVKILDNEVIKKRLVKLIGAKYQFLKDISESGPTTPMELDGEIFSTSTCMQHACYLTNFIIVCDIQKDIIFVGLRENSHVKTYSENGSTNPKLLAWTKK